jgi:3-phosphoshikimate 1-carboxyvinyltransferase
MQCLKSMEYSLPVASAQVKSCLLLAALAADGPVTLREPGPSRDHTERMLRAMGVRIDPLPGEAGAVRLYPSETPLRPLTMTLPGDISSSAFPLVAALIVSGSDVILRGVCVNPTRTGLLDALAEMGASIERRNPRVEGGEPVADLVAKTSRLSGIRVAGERVVRMIDEFPAFAVAACFAHGRTEVRDAQELRGKESDRISMLCSELRGLGVEVEEFPDGFAIEGGTLRGGTVNPHGDHRLAMSMAIAGLASQEAVTVRQMEIVRESYPGFFEMLQGLGADVRVDSSEVPTP